jgi:hypothetical protein
MDSNPEGARVGDLALAAVTINRNLLQMRRILVLSNSQTNPVSGSLSFCWVLPLRVALVWRLSARGYSRSNLRRSQQLGKAHQLTDPEPIIMKQVLEPERDVRPQNWDIEEKQKPWITGDIMSTTQEGVSIPYQRTWVEMEGTCKQM